MIENKEALDYALKFHAEDVVKPTIAQLLITADLIKLFLEKDDSRITRDTRP